MPITLTTHQVQLHAYCLMEDALSEARRYAATAAAATGDRLNIDRARWIDNRCDEATAAVRALAHLCSIFGDAEGEAFIMKRLETFHAALVPLARDCRLASFDADSAARLRTHLALAGVSA